MPSELATLRLEPAVVTGTFLDGNVTRHPESHFLDLVVDGRSLRSVAAQPDLVSELNRPWLAGVPDAVQRLQGQQPSDDLPPGRVALLVCAVDGDLGCGQLTTALTVGDAVVTWTDFRWEDGIHASSPVPRLPDRLTFDRARYEGPSPTSRRGSRACPTTSWPTADAGSCGPGSGAGGCPELTPSPDLPGEGRGLGRLGRVPAGTAVPGRGDTRAGLASRTARLCCRGRRSVYSQRTAPAGRGTREPFS